jgi:hypothetical protein
VTWCCVVNSDYPVPFHIVLGPPAVNSVPASTPFRVAAVFTDRPHGDDSNTGPQIFRAIILVSGECGQATSPAELSEVPSLESTPATTPPALQGPPAWEPANGGDEMCSPHRSVRGGTSTPSSVGVGQQRQQCIYTSPSTTSPTSGRSGLRALTDSYPYVTSQSVGGPVGGATTLARGPSSRIKVVNLIVELSSKHL